MTLTIAPPRRAALLTAAEDAAPDECCGALLGDADGRVVRELLPLPNTARDPRRAFAISPAALLGVLQAARVRGLCVLGLYHSHPRGPATPSTRDAGGATDGWSHVIIHGATLTSWRHTGRRLEEEPVQSEAEGTTA